jgi:enoyl-CoA hydratase/carnithine racemase
MSITKRIPYPKLADYKKVFAEHFEFERRNGILQVRMHTKGGPVKWSFEMHQAMCECWTTIGHDPENELIILTSTNPYWIGDFDMDSFENAENHKDKNIIFDNVWHDARRVIDNWIYDIEVPTIGAINGPGLHWENAMMSDITLCAPNFVLRDDHFGDATVPGDGQGQIIQAICGLKRGNYMMFMVNSVDAKTCLDWGLVNEIVPNEKLLPRAWEIAEKIMKAPRVIRNLTHEITVRPWKKLLHEDFHLQIGLENFGNHVTQMHHHFWDIKSRWTPAEIKIGEKFSTKAPKTTKKK